MTGEIYNPFETRELPVPLKTLPADPFDLTRMQNNETNPLVVEARRLTQAYTHLARKIYKLDFDEPSVDFKTKGCTAGWARYRYGPPSATSSLRAHSTHVSYNFTLMLHNTDDFMSDTVPHEVAHIIAAQLEGRNGHGHGQVWRSVMRAFGITPSRCHSYETRHVAQRRQNQHLYFCGCGDHFVSATLHNKLRRGETRRCVKCNQKLTSTPETY